MTDKKNIAIEIEIIESSDKSVQCIHALHQVMDYFSNDIKYLRWRNDKKAVIAWFTKRYPA